MENVSKPRKVVWLGNSLKNILEFPDGAKKLIGGELQFIQFGGMPKDAKPFKGVGSGVIEIAVKFNKDAFRCVQAVRLGDTIYVLHAFQKKSSTGIKTAKKDVDLIGQRYNEAKELAKNDHETKD